MPRVTNPLRYSNLRSLSEEHCTLTCARIVQVPDFLTKFGDDRYRRSLGEHAPQRLRSTRCRARLLGHCQDQPWVSFLTMLWYHSSSSSSNRGLGAGLREATRCSSTSLSTRSPFSPAIPHVSTRVPASVQALTSPKSPRREMHGSRQMRTDTVARTDARYGGHSPPAGSESVLLVTSTARASLLAAER